MTRAILLFKIITVVAAMIVFTSTLSNVQGAPAPVPTVAEVDAIMTQTACVCRYANGWDRVAHCGDCNPQEILTGACYIRSAQQITCAWIWRGFLLLSHLSLSPSHSLSFVGFWLTYFVALNMLTTQKLNKNKLKKIDATRTGDRWSMVGPSDGPECVVAFFF